APRDVVARAICGQISAGGRVFLDTRQALGERIGSRFPGVAVMCQKAGLDPVRDPIPVRPAAHYHMGGIKVDERVRSSLEGLWACGEVASTGLHGANRLASNSLLEALASAAWIAEDIKGEALRPLAIEPVAPDAAPRSHATGNRPFPRLAELRSLVDGRGGGLRYGEGLTVAICHLRSHLLEAAAGIEGVAVLDCVMLAVSAFGRVG